MRWRNASVSTRRRPGMRFEAVPTKSEDARGRRARRARSGPCSLPERAHESNECARPRALPTRPRTRGRASDSSSRACRYAPCSSRNAVVASPRAKAGWSTHIARNAWFVVTPSAIAPSRPRTNFHRASSRVAPTPTSFAIVVSQYGDTSPPGSSACWTRRSAGIAHARNLPLHGRKPSSGSSAQSRASIACTEKRLSSCLNAMARPPRRGAGARRDRGP